MEDKLGPAMNITAGSSFFGCHWLEVGNESVTRILIELIQHSVIQTDIMLIASTCIRFNRKLLWAICCACRTRDA